MNLSAYLLNAARNNRATGHFNASESDQFRAIAEAAKEMGAVAMIGTSEGEAAHIGYLEAVALRDALRQELRIPIFLNADHHKSVPAAKRAVDAGYDSVHIDLSAKRFDENAGGTAEVVRYAKRKDENISIEGELGYLRGESKMQNEKIEVSAADYTQPEEAKKFVEMTGVDRLAIAVGNIHGISLDEPKLDIARIAAIRKNIPAGVALTLHAASGVPDEAIRTAIKAGITNIHINTDLRVAYTEALRDALAAGDETTPYKYDAPAREALKQLVKRKLTLFGGA